MEENFYIRQKLSHIVALSNGMQFFGSYLKHGHDVRINFICFET